jgi:hypothetical protein
MRYLIIGISVLFCFLSSACSGDKGDITPYTIATLIYKNRSKQPIKILAYNKLGNVFRTIRLQDGDSIAIHLDGAPFIQPWAFATNVNSIGDSVVIYFNEEKCLSHTFHSKTGTFDLRNYDNYTPELVQQRKFTLYYTFTEEHYAQAQPCE